MLTLKGIRIAFVLTGSFCQLSAALEAMQNLREQDAVILPVFSYNVRDLDSRFGSKELWRARVLTISGAADVIDSIAAAEPVGPKQLADILLVAPCSGNTLAKMSYGITDTPALMAIKSHLRNERPVVLAVSSNDGLAANAKNIGQLLNTKHVYFVPFRQDAPRQKPTSLVADMDLIPKALSFALAGKQVQPLLLAPAE